jgi:signal transduction histidine kinase
MTDFTAVAHDLRTPLDVILGHMHLLSGETLSDAARRRLAIVEAQARRMVRLLDTYGEQDVLVLSRGVVDLTALLPSIVSELDPRLALKGITTTLTIDDGLPVIVGDVDLMHRALLNILNNAIEATPSGGRIVIRARAEEPARRIAIEIADSGTGIGPDVLPHIFARGFTTKRGRTHGLGLSICREILQRHGGDLSISSQVGHGTSVHLSLPAEVTMTTATQHTTT